MPALRTRDTQVRALEVTTDAPQPPALTVISPTPRAFTFPPSHTLGDSPYSTPSSSPFEPDLSSLTLPSELSSQPPLMRILTPDFSQSHRRRNSSTSTISSSTSSDVERRPRKGDEDYIKRPENAFILFRRKCCEERDAAAAANGDKKQRQADLSKSISQQWKTLPAEEKKHWEDLAKEKKKEHARMFPNYVYRPQRVRDKDGKAHNKKRVKKEALLEEEPDISFIVSSNARPQGRSASAPTPPPSFNTISLPSLLPTNSCPPSPSLLPMISRRAAHTGNPQDIMNDFDFRPSGSSLLAPPADYSQYFVPQRPLIDTSLISPATSSSAASSPSSGPFTPSSSWSQLSALPADFSCQTLGEDSTYVWPSSSTPLATDDFDLNSITPLQLDISKSYALESYTPDALLFADSKPEYEYETGEDFSQFSMNLDMDPSHLLEQPFSTDEIHSYYQRQPLHSDEHFAY